MGKNEEVMEGGNEGMIRELGRGDEELLKGLGEYSEKKEKGRRLYFKGEKVFLVVNPKTIEVRTDGKLKTLLEERYETVMQSRYFGRGGIEIVLAGQLGMEELRDLVRLSYDMTREKTRVGEEADV